VLAPIDAGKEDNPSGLAVAQDQNPVSRLETAPFEDDLNVPFWLDEEKKQRRRWQNE